MGDEGIEFVLTADRVVGADGVLERTAIVVSGERIVAVDSVEAIRQCVPSSVAWLDYPGCTLLPGLIDSHVHLTFSAGHFIARNLAADSDLALGLRGAANARQALLAGVTTLRDLGGRGDVALRLRDAIAAGIVPGPRVLASGRPITAPGGHLNALGGVATGRDGVTALTRDLIDQGVDSIKIIATGGNSTPTSDPLRAAFSLDELRAIIDTAHGAGLLVTAHARGVEGIRVLADSGIDGIEHCRMEVPPGRWEFDGILAEHLAERGIIAAPTLAASFRALQHLDAGGEVGIREGAIPIATRLENARRLRGAGVPVVVGTDAGACLARFDEAVHLELELLVEAGWSPFEALSAGTLGAATAIGRAGDRGSLEPGKLADLLVVRGDPTRAISDIRAVEQVYLGGQAVAKAGQLTLDARPGPWPWPKERPRYL